MRGKFGTLVCDILSRSHSLSRPLESFGMMLANRVQTWWCGHMEFVPESTELSGIFLKELALKKVDITVGASSPRDGWMGGRANQHVHWYLLG